MLFNIFLVREFGEGRRLFFPVLFIPPLFHRRTSVRNPFLTAQRQTFHSGQFLSFFFLV